jgi:hypothetical protein
LVFCSSNHLSKKLNNLEELTHSTVPNLGTVEISKEIVMVDKPNKLIVFQSKEIRRIWHEDEWYYSVVDIVAALTDSTTPRDYWYKMKIRVKEEDGFEPSTVCRQLKMEATDGKMRATDCSNTEGVLRIIQ